MSVLLPDADFLAQANRETGAKLDRYAADGRGEVAAFLVQPVLHVTCHRTVGHSDHEAAEQGPSSRLAVHKR